MEKAQLTRWRRPSSDHWRRSLRTCAAGFAASALLMLAACSGDPEFPETVGPTSTPDETGPAVYEPTLPPYTSEVELSPEDEEDVEELLLLIEQFSNYTSDITEENQAGLRSIRANLTEGMYSSYQDFAQKAAEGKISVVGSVAILDSSVWRFESDEYAMIGLCYEYDHWAVIDNNSGRPSQGHDPDKTVETMAYIEADRVDGEWLIGNQKFYSDRDDCNDLR